MKISNIVRSIQNQERTVSCLSRCVPNKIKMKIANAPNVANRMNDPFCDFLKSHTIHQNWTQKNNTERAREREGGEKASQTKPQAHLIYELRNLLTLLIIESWSTGIKIVNCSLLSCGASALQKLFNRFVAGDRWMFFFSSSFVCSGFIFGLVANWIDIDQQCKTIFCTKQNENIRYLLRIF